jgi:cytochrome P450
MPPRAPTPTAQTFRQRYDALEQRREELIARLAALGEKARANPAHSRARTLLNQSFRKASLAQRAAVLEAADWLIAVLDKASMLM